MPFKKLIKYSLFVLVIIVALTCAAQLFLTHYVNTSLKTEIESQIVKQSQGKYKLTLEKISANLFTRSITVTGVQLSPNRKASVSTQSLYYASAARLSFNSFKLMPLFIQQKLIIDKMEIVNPVAAIYRSEEIEPGERKKPVDKFTLYKLIQKKLQSLFIATIEIKNADIKIFNHADDLKPSLNSNDNSISVINFKIDKSTDDQNRFFIADKIELEINNFSYITKDSLYVMKVKKVNASYTDSVIRLHEITMLPNFSKQDFGDVVGRQATRMKVSILESCLDKMDVKQFFEHGWMRAKVLELDSLRIEAYRDKNDEFRNPVAKSVQQLIREIPFFIAIDSVKVNDGFITYEELAEDAKYKGKVIFNNVSSVITGLSNDSVSNKNGRELIMNATADFMNKGELEVRYCFPLNTSNNVFSCSGKIFHLPLNSLNIILEPSANVSIKEGIVDSMLFSFNANEVESKGTMKLAYHNLKIEFLNKKHEKPRLVEKLKTVFANELVIRKNNPSGNDPLREGVINFPHDRRRFMFYYTWKSLLSGIKSTMGLN